MPYNRILSFVSFVCIFSSAVSCTDSQNEPVPPEYFDSIPTAVVTNPVIKEASGITASRKNPGNLWVIEDSGNPNEVILLDNNGVTKKRMVVANSFNRDWEDISWYHDSLYVAEIGDNNRAYSDYIIYILPEPDENVDTIKSVRAVHIKYPDGSHDAETLFVDQATGDIYLITKNDQPSQLYKLSFPYDAAMNTLVKVADLNYTGVVSAALSSNGALLIIKTYDKLRYYQRKNNDPFEVLVKQDPIILPYIQEPQGEAVCFSKNDDGYYTLSEQLLTSVQKLYFYKKK